MTFLRREIYPQKKAPEMMTETIPISPWGFRAKVLRLVQKTRRTFRKITATGAEKKDIMDPMSPEVQAALLQDAQSNRRQFIPKTVDDLVLTGTSGAPKTIDEVIARQSQTLQRQIRNVVERRNSHSSANGSSKETPPPPPSDYAVQQAHQIRQAQPVQGSSSKDTGAAPGWARSSFALSALENQQSDSALPAAPPQNDDEIQQAIYESILEESKRQFLQKECRQSDEHTKLVQKIGNYGLRERDVEGDGNCQFRALSDQLCGCQNKHREIRNQICEQLRKDWHFYKAFTYSSVRTPSGGVGTSQGTQKFSVQQGAPSVVKGKPVDECFVHENDDETFTLGRNERVLETVAPAYGRQHSVTSRSSIPAAGARKSASFFNSITNFFSGRSSVNGGSARQSASSAGNGRYGGGGGPGGSSSKKRARENTPTDDGIGGVTVGLVPASAVLPVSNSQAKQRISQAKAEAAIEEDEIDVQFHDYLQKMKEDKTWGDHVTLQAFADSQKIQVNLITTYDDESVISILPRTVGPKAKPERTIWLTFWAEVHYNSVEECL